VLVLALIGAGLACKKQPQPEVQPAKNPPSAKPDPAVRAAQPVVAKKTAEQQVVAPQPPPEVLPARVPRPAGRRHNCTPMARVLASHEGLETFKWKAPLARHWVLVTYAETSDGGLPEDQSYLYLKRAPGCDANPLITFTDYFSGLKPGLLGIIHDGGPAKVDAIREKYRIKADKFSMVNTGYFSDHCYKTRIDEEALFFSILLTDDIALQAFADYGPYTEDDFYQEGSPHVPASDAIPRRVYDRIPTGDKMRRPIKSLYLQTMRLSDGAVIDGPKSVPVSGIAHHLGPGGLSLATIGKNEDSPVALAFSWLHFVAVVTRAGQIPVFREVRCNYAIDVWGDKDRSGTYHLVVTERRTNRLGEADNQICRVGSELEKEAGIVKAPATTNPAPSTESPARD
jgi:hypothetical protein